MGRQYGTLDAVAQHDAKRVSVVGAGADASLRELVSERAARLGVCGWVRLAQTGMLCAHVEGEVLSIQDLTTWLKGLDGVEAVSESSARVEGHEQFKVRGVPAGVFVVQEHQATAHHFDFRLEVNGIMRSWAVPKGPSTDPAVKRFAIEVEDHEIAHNDFEGTTGSGAVIIWDRGSYEQGGRVPWPEALDRGHAVFVLHGQKLSGGFALQRTSAGPKPQWLLIKRRDEHAQPGFDIVAAQPRSVRSGFTLGELLDN